MSAYQKVFQAFTGLVVYLSLAINTSAQANSEDTDQQLLNSLKQALSENTSYEDPYLAQIWLSQMSNQLKPWIKDNRTRLDLLNRIHREATLANLDPGLVLALIQVESNFDRFAISSAGARGLMQIMPFWIDEIGRPEDNLFDLDTNLRYGCTILAHYLKIEDGNLIPALARYNGSRGKTWYPDRVLRYWHNRWRFSTD